MCTLISHSPAHTKIKSDRKNHISKFHSTVELKKKSDQMKLIVVAMHCIALLWLWNHTGNICTLTLRQMLLSKRQNILFFQFEVSPLVKSAFSFQKENNFGLCEFPVFYPKMSQTFGKHPDLDLCFFGQTSRSSPGKALHYLGVSNVIP